MPFNINTFKSKLDLYGGPAKTNLFEVTLTGSINSEIIPAGDLVFFCKTIQIPGINFNLLENKPQGVGLPQSFPIGYSSEPLNCIFILDSRHFVLSFFHIWMQNIINYDTTNLFAPQGYDPTHFPHEINYRDEYEMDMDIKYYGQDGVPYLVQVRGVYPSQVGSINLSWDENDQIANLPVNFSYKQIKYQATTMGEVQADVSRGYIGLQRSIVQRGEIQRAVDAFTSIPANIFSTIGKIKKAAGDIRSLFR
jgi:hypothetical protein